MTITREQALENLGAEEVAHRQQAERLWLAKEQAFAAYDAAFDARPRQESAEESDAHADVAPLKAAFDAADAAWAEFDTNGDVVIEHGEVEPKRCALTNCIIHEEDDYLECNGIGNYVLVDALGLEESVFAALTGRVDDDSAAGGRTDDGESPDANNDEAA